ncbi:hypothetical protein EDB89DRAFT_2041659, partial [Lactarius sanguifluus]
MPTKDICILPVHLRWDCELCFACRCTRNQVPMSLTLCLKRELEEPFKLAVHGYETPEDLVHIDPDRHT